MKAKHIFDRYANAVIGGRPQDFDAVEVHGTREATAADGNAVIDDEHPDFFSVYLHYKEGNIPYFEGLQCAGDFSSRDDAIQYATELREEYGWSMYNHVPADAKPMRAWQRMSNEALLEAAKLNDIDAAALHVQKIAGITDGGIAGLSLDNDMRERWPRLCASERVMALEYWRDAEQGADLDYAPREPENLDATLILAGLRLLQRELESADVPMPIIEIMEGGGIDLNVTDESAVAQHIDSLCERINSANTIVTSRSVISNLLPYARSRAEDIAEQAGDNHEMAKQACAAVEAGYKAINEKP